MDIIPKIFIFDQANKLSDFANDDMKLALCNGPYDECTMREIHTFDQISSQEIPSNYGYIAGGLPVFGKVVDMNDPNIPIRYDISNIEFTVSGGMLGPIRYGVMYNTTNDNHLVYIFDFEKEVTVNDGAKLQLRIDDKGLMYAEQPSESK